MSKNGAVFRVIPYAASQIAVVAGSWPVDAAFPAANLANVQPKVVLRSTAHRADSFIVLDLDLGQDTLIDGIAVLHTNFSSGAGWAILGATQAQGPMAGLGSEPAGRRLFGQTGVEAFGIVPTTTENRRYGFIARQSHTIRYLRVYFYEPLATTTQIGTLAVLQRLAMGQPAYTNFELGSGRRVDDRSQLRGLPGGETAIERGGLVPQWRASWSSVTEAEYRQLWYLLMEAGTSRPVLAAEFQDLAVGQAEALHYGLIQSIDFTERVQMDKQRIDLRFQELV